MHIVPEDLPKRWVMSTVMFGRCRTVHSKRVALKEPCLVAYNVNMVLKEVILVWTLSKK